MCRKKVLEPIAKREVVSHFQAKYKLSERRSCQLVKLSGNFYCYRTNPRDDSKIQKVLTELAEQHPEFGFRKVFLTLRRLEKMWNHKRVYRVYCSMKLNRRRKHKRRVPTRNPLPLVPKIVNGQPIL